MHNILPKRYAAIDIGSNAVRLLIADITTKNKEVTFKKNTLIRVPLRLGDEAFLNGLISEEKAKDLLDTMQAFATLMEVYKVQAYRACATSAMREARNGAQLAEAIQGLGVDLKIIDGAKEAEIIYGTRLEMHMEADKSYLFVDVGGGSTELSMFHEGELLASKSFDIGTIRLLDERVKKSEWDRMRRWLEKNTDRYKKIITIGTGGNINKLFSLSGQKEGRPLSFNKLKQQYEYLSAYNLEERIELLGLKEDRADVIIPAAHIFIQIMKWSKSRQVMIPRLGLADGLIQTIIETEHKL